MEMLLFNTKTGSPQKQMRSKGIGKKRAPGQIDRANAVTYIIDEKLPVFRREETLAASQCCIAGYDETIVGQVGQQTDSFGVNET